MEYKLLKLSMGLSIVAIVIMLFGFPLALHYGGGPLTVFQAAMTFLVLAVSAILSALLVRYLK